MTQQGIDSIWKTHLAGRYAKTKRSRPYALSNDAKRWITWLWLACERVQPDNPGELFESSLAQFADAGVNVLQPAPPADIKPPEMWKDIWGNPLPNPFATKDLKGQTLLAQRDPQLAKWLKAFAESPYTAATSWSDEQATLLKRKALVYDSDTHTVNPWVNGANETEKAKFVRNADKAAIERCQWEAKPVTFPHAQDFDLTAQSKIASVPRLSALWNAMTTQEGEYVTAEKAALQRQRQEAETRLHALEASDTAPQPPRLAARARIGAE
jgi:hypothetical protein